ASWIHAASVIRSDWPAIRAAFTRMTKSRRKPKAAATLHTTMTSGDSDHAIGTKANRPRDEMTSAVFREDAGSEPRPVESGTLDEKLSEAVCVALHDGACIDHSGPYTTMRGRMSIATRADAHTRCLTAAEPRHMAAASPQASARETVVLITT